jgi:hypothetical protein
VRILTPVTPLAVLLFSQLAAQPAAQPPEPAFEVVSIRTVPANAPPLYRDINFSSILPGGQYVDTRTSLLFMISFAYRVGQNRLVGLPNGQPINRTP